MKNITFIAILICICLASLHSLESEKNENRYNISVGFCSMIGNNESVPALSQAVSYGKYGFNLMVFEGILINARYNVLTRDFPDWNYAQLFIEAGGGYHLDDWTGIDISVGANLNLMRWYQTEMTLGCLYDFKGERIIPLFMTSIRFAIYQNEP